MFEETKRFVKRNGFKSIVLHIVETYISFLFRFLPGIEGLLLRRIFYRCMFIACGKSLIIYPNVYISFSHKISAGQCFAVNVGTYIDAQGGLTVGDHVMIGPNCVITTAGHGHGRTDIPMYYQTMERAPINIEDDVWISGNVVVVPGVRIGRGSIIAAGSVVVKDVPPYSVYGGVPAKFLHAREHAVPDLRKGKD